MSRRSARNDAAAQSHVEPDSGAHRVVSKRPSEARERASVQEYFDRFTAAMTSGDTKALLKFWGVPAFVIGRNEARVVQSESDVEAFFAGAKDMYNARGITTTRAEITNLDWVGEDLVMATVRWPYLDGNDRTLGEESSTYTLLRGEDGSFKMRVITLRGSSDDAAANGDREDGTDDE